MTNVSHISTSKVFYRVAYSNASCHRDSPDDCQEDARHVRTAAALVIQIGQHHLTAVEAHSVRRFSTGQQTHGARSVTGHRLVDHDGGRLGSVPD